MDQHRAYLDPVGTRCAPCRPHESCYQGWYISDASHSIDDSLWQSVAPIPNICLVKGMVTKGQGHSQGNVGHILGPVFNRYVPVLFPGNWVIFVVFWWDIANTIFYHENSRSRSGRNTHFWPHLSPCIQSMCIYGNILSLAFNRYICFSFCGNWTMFG